MEFLTEIDPRHGQVVQISPLVRRVVCNNPGRFTFTGTGTYIVGRGQVAVIDPGPDDDEHVAAVLAAVAGEDVTHIAITHTHRDHSPATRLMQTETGAPTYGFGPHPVADAGAAAAAKPTTWAELMPSEAEFEELRESMPAALAEDGAERHTKQEEPGDMDFCPDFEIGHGDVIKGGTWTLEALHTPGHISNHLCFGLREEPALFTGDHVMGWSTSVIPPPDGSMVDYMASLRLLLDRDDQLYYPTHGPPVPQPIEFTRALIDHRLDRERQILDCLRDGPKTIPAMVTAMYTATPHILHVAAGQSVLSHLLFLAETGQVTTEGPPTADSVFSSTLA